MNLIRMLNYGPWTFENRLLITHHIQPGDNVLKVPIEIIPIWIHILDLPTSFHSANVGICIGNNVGRFLQSDPTNFNGHWNLI